MTDEDLIPLSGLQHVQFCPRQFALIHLEGVWRENVLTAQGRVLHENAHDPFFTEKRGDTIISRSVPIVSYKLGVSGEADVIEFHKGDAGVALDGRDGLWQPVPIEYKRGKKKAGPEDEIQLCAQGMCIEEMLCANVPLGYLFYWETRTRVEVMFTAKLRAQVVRTTEKAQGILADGVLPAPDRPKTQCKRCSLMDECLPAAKTKKSAVDFVLAQLKENGI
jgi:CRISPR-associated exonuclease Cas4